MNDLLQGTSLFPILLTLAAFLMGQWLQKKTGLPLCNPILLATLAVIGVLLVFHIPNEEYQAGCRLFSWLLTPATVCLALPLYEQLQALRKNLPAILAGVLSGTVSSLACVFLFCRIFSFNDILTVSLLPKSITTAMGIALSDQMGGNAAVTTAAIIITGISGSILGPVLCRLFHLKEPVAQGVAFGTAAHVIGTSKANEMSPVSGAVGSLALVIAGILTAVLMPFA